MYQDSTGKPISVGSTVRFRGGIYTIRAFIPSKGRGGCARIEFQEAIPMPVLEKWGMPDEVAVDLFE